jgi:DNA helicase IV
MMRVTNLKIHDTDKEVFFKSTLPFTFAYEYTNKPEFEKFDYLVIDEAQDLISETHLEAFDCMLKGGIAYGQWTMLGDFNNQALYTDSKPEALIDSLRSKASISLLRLKYNCRNPRLINEKNTSMTGCERLISWEGMPDGEDVKKIFVNTVPDAINAIEKIIIELANKKVPYKRISLLSQRDTIDLIGGSKIINAAHREGMVIETVKSYKGLENSYIVLYDFHTLDSNEGIKTLYVGISRAKFKLYLVFSSSLKKDYENLIRRHIKP